MEKQARGKGKKKLYFVLEKESKKKTSLPLLSLICTICASTISEPELKQFVVFNGL